jgi:hypothetical protein
MSHNGHDLASHFPQIVEAVRGLPIRTQERTSISSCGNCAALCMAAL